MSKPEWGEKRICQDCKGLFYDMQRSPIVCPKCNAEFNPEAGKKPRRAKGGRVKEAVKIQEQPVIPALYEEELSVVENLEGIEEIELEDDTFIEDTSELEDDDDEVEGIIDMPKRLTE